MYEEYPDKEVLDGEVNIYLNTKGTDSSGVSGELVALLKYFEETTDDIAISSGYERRTGRRVPHAKALHS